MLQHTSFVPKLVGRVQPWVRDERTGLITPRNEKSNQIQFGWGFAAAMQLGFRRPSRLDYSIAGMYLEYENVADPEDVVDVPESFDRDQDLEYYADLAGSGVRDYLRVALLQTPLLSIAEGYEAYFTEGETGNQLTFMAMTSGVTGVHGKAFSAAANSKVVGGCLVAVPTWADRTKDIVVARTYFPAEDHVVKGASQQIGVTWSLIFG
jgi:hypothetical protein